MKSIQSNSEITELETYKTQGLSSVIYDEHVVVCSPTFTACLYGQEWMSGIVLFNMSALCRSFFTNDIVILKQGTCTTGGTSVVC